MANGCFIVATDADLEAKVARIMNRDIEIKNNTVIDGVMN